jgi:hypothetical protein
VWESCTFPVRKIPTVFFYKCAYFFLINCLQLNNYMFWEKWKHFNSYDLHYSTPKSNIYKTDHIWPNPNLFIRSFSLLCIRDWIFLLKKKSFKSKSICPYDHWSMNKICNGIRGLVDLCLHDQ